MKFSIGDIVLLKRTGEEGRVTELLGAGMLEVEVNGTHFPVFLDEVDHPYLKWFTEQRKAPAGKRSVGDIPAENAKAKMPQVATGFHLSFVPVFKFDEFDEVVDKLKVYFINQTGFELTLQYECTGFKEQIFNHKASILPYSHFYLHDIGFEHMHEQPRFNYIFERTDEVLGAVRLSDTLRIKPKKLFEYISQLQMGNQPMFYVKLADEFAPIVKEKKEATMPPKVHAPSIAQQLSDALRHRKQKPLTEIDLHIEKLVENFRGMSSFEMLGLQMEAFERALYNAINHNQQSLTVIHGVGKGRLKEEIHAVLRNTPEVDFFQHDWSPRYGYGATQIFFRY
ncbi:MAG: Smr/MutS family protein [Edaphocola sp.]